MAQIFSPVGPRPHRPFRRSLIPLVSGGWWARHARFRSLIASLTVLVYSSLAIAGPVLLRTAGSAPVQASASASTEDRHAGRGWLRVLSAVIDGVLGGSTAHAQIALQPPFTTDYQLTDLGSVPGLPPSYGGVVFKHDDASTLLIGGAANSVAGKLYAVRVVRNATNHIIGFTGTATVFAEAAYNDGGIVYGPHNVLFLARWPVNQLGQTKLGSTITDKVINLAPFGVGGSSLAALNFVPVGFPGAGQLKFVSWVGGNWYSVNLAPDPVGTFNVTSVTSETVIGGGPEGFVYVPAGSLQFPDFKSLLVSEWSAGNVVAYQIDTKGNPLPTTRRVFISRLTGAEGAVLDPVTGDFLFSTFGGGNRVIVVQGFAPPARCDVDRNGVIDQQDISAIVAARDTTVQLGDVRDADTDGLITVNDGRACVLKCSKPQCSDNAQPVANAGPDQTVGASDRVVLDGRGSFDANGGALTFAWTFVSRPSGSSAAVSGATAPQPEFVADRAGEFVLQLVVHDGTQSSVADTVMVTATARTVVVPNVVGVEQAAANTTIETAGLRVDFALPANSTTVPEGVIISQTPVAGSSVDAGTGVNLVVSMGAVQTTVPNVVGTTPAQAATTLRQAGLFVGTVTEEPSATVPAGQVLRQAPVAGTHVAIRSAVDLVLSSGGVAVTVPNVVGQPQSTAQGTLEAAGLLVGTISSAGSATVPAGSVMSQNPAAGSSVFSGSSVTLVISLGPLPGGDVSRPIVQLTATPTVTFVGETVTLQVTATEESGLVTPGLRVNGTPVTLVANGTATFTSATPGVFTAETTAIDAAGNTGFANTEFRFQTPGDATQPTVSITSSADGAELTMPTPITGSVSDETTLVRYVVEASPAGQDEFFRIASGTTAVTNGVLGTIDPTLLLNGLYDVRVVVEDASGNVTSALRTYEVDGQAKVGNFSISFEDLTIPVAGIPITITRTYDSRNKATGDFGVGWTLAIKDLQVFESTILGRHWEQVQTSGLLPKFTLEPKRPHTVTVRFPDGRLDTFNMGLTLNPQTLIPIDFPSAFFTPAPGTLSLLVSLDGNNLIVYPPTTGPVIMALRGKRWVKTR
jgi:beta-lactam-binding protein with PASTA domain